MVKGISRNCGRELLVSQFPYMWSDAGELDIPAVTRQLEVYEYWDTKNAVRHRSHEDRNNFRNRPDDGPTEYIKAMLSLPTDRKSIVRICEILHTPSS